MNCNLSFSVRCFGVRAAKFLTQKHCPCPLLWMRARGIRCVRRLAPLEKEGGGNAMSFSLTYEGRNGFPLEKDGVQKKEETEEDGRKRCHMLVATS